MVRLNVNGTEHQLKLGNDTPLLWALREHLQLPGTKYGCGVGICGICTVLVDGEAVRSCVAPVGDLQGQGITTIEGLNARGHPLLKAWVDEQVPQCGYCQPGQIMAAAALLEQHPHPDEAQINQAMNGIYCRCGTYPRIRHAIDAVTRDEHARATPLPIPAAVDNEGVALDEWIRITPANRVIVTINHTEMGQGVNTALATLIAEELEVDLTQISTVFAPAAPRYRNPMFNEQTTGGSTSIRGEWRRLSEAGARARHRLIHAAAEQWGVRRKDCRAERGAVVHRPSGRRLAYAELARDARKISSPRRVRLKAPQDYRLLGRSLPRLEIPDMVRGTTRYGMDIELPDMRIATVQRCPWLDGRLQNYDGNDALAIRGVEKVVPISNGVAVIARDTWAALEGQQALKLQWQTGSGANLNNVALYAQLYQALDEQQSEIREQKGKAQRAFDKAQQQREAEYTLAPVAHATLETMNCTVDLKAHACDLWLGTQSPEAVRETAAQISGLPLGKVRVHSQFAGGAFGRRLDTDMVAEALEIAKAIEQPVKLVWTRVDDMQHDHYRPPFVSRLRAGLDANGHPLAWHKRCAGPNVAVQAWQDLPYSIKALRSEFVEIDLPLPDGAWRAVGAGQDAFAVECFIDELAEAAGQDPLAYRIGLLNKAPRHRAVLERVAAESGWFDPPPRGRSRGVALYQSFGSYVAQIAEVSVTDNHIHVHRIVCVIDCGRTVNTDALRAQLEGGIIMGISVALKEAITVEDGRVQQATFEDYPILRFSEVPELQIHIMQSNAEPGGVGEPGLPPVAPAIANAVAAATGVRLRHLPLSLDTPRHARNGLNTR